MRSNARLRPRELTTQAMKPANAQATRPGGPVHRWLVAHPASTLALLGTALLAVAATPSQAAPTVVNGLVLDGAALDASGDKTVANGRLGYFSDLFYDPVLAEWWALSDRGPGGGRLSHTPRAHRFTLDIDASTGTVANFRIAQTVLLRRDGQPLDGRAPTSTSTLGTSFDPEALVVHPRTGHLFISDEYGPSLAEFSRDGQWQRSFSTPANLVPRNTTTGPYFANDDGSNNAGRRVNRGFEGLAISPDGRFLFAMLQGALLDEGGGDGKLLRIVKFDISSDAHRGQAVAQYAYAMKRSGQGQGISALVALNDHELLVLERNNRGVGVEARLDTAEKQVFRIDLTGATDVSTLNLAGSTAFTPVRKSGPLLDLAAPTLPALGGHTAEKWEGLAIGPRLANGDWLLLAGSDNDFSVTQDKRGDAMDVWFDFSAPDPYAASLQCPLDKTTGCRKTSDGRAADWRPGLKLLPGVLQAWRVPAADLPGYQPPGPAPAKPAR